VRSRRLQRAKEGWRRHYRRLAQTHAPVSSGSHPLNSENYDEELWFMDRSFDCYMYTLHFNIPSYYDWLYKRDQRRNIEEILLWF